MNTSMMVDFASQFPTDLQDTGTRTAFKFPAAFENARKACLRTLYGFQPATGRHYGRVLYAKAKGSVVIVEIYFYAADRSPIGVFEMPLHHFKNDGEVIVNSADAEKFAGRQVYVTVAGRYKFNGISLSTVTCVEMHSTAKPNLIVLAQPKATQE